MKHRQAWKGTLILVIVSILLPYAGTLLLEGQPASRDIEELYSGRVVELADSSAVDAEEYLVGLTAAQIPISYGKEAVKAQAVLARTGLYRAMGASGRVQETDLSSRGCTLTEMERVWGENMEKYYLLVRQAVAETAGETVQYDGNYIEPLYHLANGGTTRTDGSGYFPYLKAVRSSRDLELSGCIQAVILTEEELAAALTAIRPEQPISPEGLVESIQIVEKDSSGYVNRIMIGGVEYTGTEAARAVRVSSCCFTIGKYGPETDGVQQIQVVASGIGHGYGMSQYGASKLAEEGADYRQILEYYFTGAKVVKEADENN